MRKIIFMATLALLTAACQTKKDNDKAPITKPEITIEGGRLTPEGLWAMGRINSVHPDTESGLIAYTVSYYSIEENRSTSWIRVCKVQSDKLETIDEFVGHSPAWHKGDLCYINKEGQVVIRKVQEVRSLKVQEVVLTGFDKDIEGFLLSPLGDKIILIAQVKTISSTADKYPDLPLASGRIVDDLMYKHWDEWTETAPHPFLCEVSGLGVQKCSSLEVVNCVDLLEGTPYESPMKPFGGVEQLAWSPDGKQIAYTCRKLSGLDYAISTDSDIYLYDLESGNVKNLCKPEGYVRPACDPTRSLKHQAVNQFKEDVNAGYDQNPQFSPDGKYIAWSSMERDGYESDRTRLCIYEFATGKKSYVTESFESGVNEFAWASDNNTLYFSGVWHGKTNLYSTNLQGNVKAITNEVADFVLLGIHPNGQQLLAKCHSMSRADEVYLVNIADGETTQLTAENEPFYAHFQFGEVRERWIETTDKKQMLAWVILPPNFDPTKKYPTLLFCEGGPQSPVSQFWSYRWNFQVMANQGYVIIAPNRRGLPGFGMEWLEQISGDYSGQCMKDYLSAIDDIAKEPWGDNDRLGAVGASFGGYSVYWLAGNHDKRFKAFIAHDGIFNTQQQYMETEELWFPNWDMGQAPWYKDANGKRAKVFETSPHLYVDRWDTPILCIHGQKDFRIEYTQAESAFTAARLRGIPAQLLLFPDENHWVLKPQNGILWQRTFFRWLDKWLKAE
ncbi:MAG: S9 family peptidase [Bacteroidaceae bacterium]|nr:S9 family peptidase [Bacteroidaceae bacterium]